MRTYIIKRLLLMIPTLFGITLITFTIIHLAPGEVPIMAGDKTGRMRGRITSEQLEAWRRLNDLDKPIHVQYWKWLQRLARLDFGTSFKDGRPVIEKIAERLPITMTLSFTAMFLVYLISIPLGVHSATHQYQLSDRITTFIIFVLYSLPSFWVAHMLLTYACGGEYLNLFPLAGVSSPGASEMGPFRWFLDRVWHLVLPVLCYTYRGLAGLSRYARAGMLEVLRQDYIRTARAKGLAERVVIMKHAFRNSIIPIVTLLGGLLPALLSASVIVEQIFSIPGIGRLGFEAVLNRDYPVIMGFATIGATLTLLGILMSDLLYAVADPRISYESDKS
jgi:peptide/nickel transport system permease protein